MTPQERYDLSVRLGFAPRIQQEAERTYGFGYQGDVTQARVAFINGAEWMLSQAHLAMKEAKND